jgi:hypothetical protein
MKKLIKQSNLFMLYLRLKIAFEKIKNGALNEFCNISFSQEGEDLVISRHLENSSEGFYVEVGALSPKRFSNTWLFYTMGWNGILIEPNPSVKLVFEQQRPRDFFINEGVSSQEQNLTYYQFCEPALNTFSHEVSEQRRLSGWPYIGETTIRTRSLTKILEQHLPIGKKIRLLSIDVEGFDEIVIRSNDWEKFRPEWLIVEILGGSLAELNQHPISLYLTEKGYHFFAKTGHSVIFRECI